MRLSLPWGRWQEERWGWHRYPACSYHNICFCPCFFTAVAEEDKEAEEEQQQGSTAVGCLTPLLCLRTVLQPRMMS